MEIRTKIDPTKGPAEMFTGEVSLEPIARGNAPSTLAVTAVHLAPGARTAWHSHSHGQTLHVTEGEGLVQSRGEPVISIHTGDTVDTPADEWHWHGATPEHAIATSPSPRDKPLGGITSPTPSTRRASSIATRRQSLRSWRPEHRHAVLARPRRRGGRMERISSYVIIEAPSILGLFPGGVERLPEALLAAGFADRLGRAPWRTCEPASLRLEA